MPEVAELYAECPAGIGATNRHEVAGETPVTVAGLKRLARLCVSRKVPLNLLCNTPVLPAAARRPVFELIKHLPGLSSVTLSDPLVFREFKKNFPALELHASVIANIDSPAKARAALGEGITEIVLPSWLNRSGPGLRAMARLKREFSGFRIKLFANLPCAPHCLYAARHYLLGAAWTGSDSGGKNAAAFSCGSLPRTVGQFIRIPVIRPEDVSLYLKRGLADKIKICFRSYGSERLRRTCLAYAAGSYGGDLQDLVTLNPELGGVRFAGGLIPVGFAAKVLSCAGNCPDCGYCDGVARRVIHIAG